MKNKVLWIIAPLTLVATSCDLKLNEDIRVEAGSTTHEEKMTVNGSIYIGDNSRMDGNIRTVNGDIVVGKRTTVRADIQSVNGNIFIEDNADIIGDIESVNGTIGIDSAVTSSGDIGTVSGTIRITAARHDGDILTRTADITLQSGTIINGSIIIKKSDELPEKLRTLEIMLRDSSLVNGDIDNREPRMQVLLHVQPGSKVNGELLNVSRLESPRKP